MHMWLTRTRLPLLLHSLSSPAVPPVPNRMVLLQLHLLHQPLLLQLQLVHYILVPPQASLHRTPLSLMVTVRIHCTHVHVHPHTFRSLLFWLPTPHQHRHRQDTPPLAIARGSGHGSHRGCHVVRPAVGSSEGWRKASRLRSLARGGHAS